MSADDLIVSLRRTPSPEEHAIAEGVGLHDGAGVPFHMFVKVANWAHRHGLWIGERDDLEKKIKRRANAALGLLATAILTVIGGVAHRLVEEGASSERAVQAEQRAIERRDAIEREIQDLRLDVRELRAEMRRLSGAEIPKVDSNDDTGFSPEGKFSDLGKWNEILASGVPSPGPKPNSSCGRICSSSIECTSLVPSCKFCNFGTCKATLPEEPQQPPPDAGVDAPDGTAP